MKRSSPLLALALAACATTPKPEATPRQRELPEEPQAERVAPLSRGSLVPTTGGLLVSGSGTLQLGDLIVVKVSESAAAQRSASTETERASKVDGSVDAGLTFGAQTILPETSLKAGLGGSREYRGQGTTDRSERVTATVPVRVRRLLRNGNAFVEGHRLVVVNGEQQRLYVSGIIRAVDVAPDNTVLSSQIAEAEIEFTGKGDVSDGSQPNVVQRALAPWWPF